MCVYYQHTQRGGGRSHTDPILALLKWEWRKLCARIKSGPEEIYRRFLEYVNAKVCYMYSRIITKAN